MTLKELETSLVIEWYEALEERLSIFLRFVPPVPENLEVLSHVLAGIITEACGLLDSLFRQAATTNSPIVNTAAIHSRRITRSSYGPASVSFRCRSQ